MKAIIGIQCGRSGCNNTEVVSVNIHGTTEDDAEIRIAIDNTNLPPGWGVDAHGVMMCAEHAEVALVSTKTIEERRAEALCDAATIMWAKRYYDDVGFLLKLIKNKGRRSLKLVRSIVEERLCTDNCRTVNDACVSGGCLLSETLNEGEE